MFNKTCLSKIRVFAGMALCALAVLASPCAALTSYAADPGDVSVCTEFREWRFKIEDGKLWRRLYNASTGLWETDWLYVGEYDGPSPT